MTFLWRAQGAKKESAANPFKDIKKSDYYYNSVLWAVVSFALVWAAGIIVLNATMPHDSSSYGIIALHILMAAYFAHLLSRTIYMTVRSRGVLRMS